MNAVLGPEWLSAVDYPYGPARRQIFDMMNDPDTFAKSDEELLPAQLAAAQEYFEEMRPRVKILDKRAKDTRTDSIKDFTDIVELLFSHTTYKTYPLSLIVNGRWDRMTQWLGTLSANSLDNVDLTDIVDIDDWIERLQAAGHLVATSSGTSGKVSLLNRTHADTAMLKQLHGRFSGWPAPIEAKRDRHFFSLAPKEGAQMLIYHGEAFADLFGRPDSIHFLTEDRLRVGGLMRAAEMRQKIASSTAQPEEVAEFQEAAKLQAEKLDASVETMVDRILAVRREPAFISGLWAMYWRLMEKARERGIPDGDFNPETLAGAGGGLKGLNLPSDYADQVFNFLRCKRMGAYGMSEMTVSQPRCDAGRMHREPWTIQLMLDDEGEQLLDMRRSEGVIQGRFAFLDLAQHGHWGGVITGDKVEMAFGRCPCGRNGPTILPTITRYANLGEDDKIGCAGTIESYIRGEMQ